MLPPPEPYEWRLSFFPFDFARSPIWSVESPGNTERQAALDRCGLMDTDELFSLAYRKRIAGERDADVRQGLEVQRWTEGDADQGSSGDDGDDAHRVVRDAKAGGGCPQDSPLGPDGKDELDCVGAEHAEPSENTGVEKPERRIAPLHSDS
ncbi:MAG: hypothetical protein K0S65_4452, partial [Labilithrix sp.]|nr:hypothetical protein [Labilithrix sp.]